MKTKHKTKEEKQAEALKLLPASISDIQVQKKNSHRFSLFVENRFLMGVSESTLTKLNIKKGVEITPSLFWRITETEEQWAAREYFFRLLSRRDHSRKELRDKAYKKGYKGEFIEKLLDEFEQKEYIDDRKFALKYATDKFEFNKWGPYKIRTQLFKKGVSKVIAEQVLQQVFEEEDIRESMIELVQKKKRKYQRTEPEKRKKKLFDFFMRKGYDSEYIMKYIDELLAIIEA